MKECMGKCFIFTCMDPEDSREYLHIIPREEAISWIEITFLTTPAEKLRREYMELHGTRVESDYFISHGLKSIPAAEDRIVRNCLRVVGIKDPKVVELKEPAHPVYVRENGKWIKSEMLE